jgi:pimeloyl-ACP methyl ester carboxylesterase
MFGEKDRYISKETAQGLVERYKQAQVLWLANSGHNGFIEEPGRVGEKVNEFMS